MNLDDFVKSANNISEEVPYTEESLNQVKMELEKAQDRI
jgi:hypothetical protein